MHGIASRLVFVLCAAALVAGCGSSDSDTGVVPTPTVITPTPVPTTAATTTGKGNGNGKHGKGKGHGKGHGKGKPTGTTGPVATAPVQTVQPEVTTDPNLVKVKVLITADAITLSPSTLPAGKGMMFLIRGRGVGKKGYALFKSGGEGVGVSRVIPSLVHMETKSLVKGQLEITISGTNRIHITRKLVPVG